MSTRREGEPPDVPQFKDIGAPETGDVVESESVTVSQITLPYGTTKAFSHSSTIRVTTLSTEPLDPAFVRGACRVSEG